MLYVTLFDFNGIMYDRGSILMYYQVDGIRNIQNESPGLTSRFIKITKNTGHLPHLFFDVRS